MANIPINGAAVDAYNSFYLSYDSGYQTVTFSSKNSVGSATIALFNITKRPTSGQIYPRTV